MKLNIVHKFALLSIGVTVTISTGLNLLVTNILTTGLLQHEARITSQAIYTVTNIDLTPAAFHRAIGNRNYDTFEYIWSHLRQIPGAFRMKVYGAERQVVWANEPQLIGKTYRDNEELEKSLAGSVQVEMGKAKQEHEYERGIVPEGEILEIYVPLFSPGDGNAYGVIELYKHSTGFFASKRQLNRIVWTAGIGGGLMLYVSLLGLFRSAMREQMRLQKIETRYAQIELELEVARSLQQSLLPTELPRVDGFSLAAYHEACREIGGDFYDALVTQNGSVALALADGEGKGIPGALLMVEARSVLRTQIDHSVGVASVMRAVNDALVAEGDHSGTATAFLAKLDAEAKTIACCSGGHCPALFVSDGHARWVDAGGPILGFQSGLEYEEETVALRSGDVLLMYTDGVTEAMDPEGALFGRQRLAELLVDASHDGRAQAVVAEVRAALRRFRAGAAQSDDTAMVCLAVD